MAITRPITKTIISTTDFGIPVVDAVNANTAAIAANVPTAWTAITLQNGWTNVVGWQNAQYRKVGDNVQIRGYVTGAGTGLTAFTLPVGFRPAIAANLTSSRFANPGGRLIQLLQIWPDGHSVLESPGESDLTAFFSTL